ncbi:hypothetical protein ABKN59_009049 [Abortiporus biennis]
MLLDSNHSLKMSMPISSPPAIPPGVSIGGTLGAVFLGTVIAAMLFGITCSQLFAYFTQGKRDDHPLFQSITAQFAICTSDAVIRSIFTYRIWKLSKSWWITGPNVIGIIVVLAFGWKNMASEIQLKSFLYFGEISTDIYIGFGGSALIDTIIASTLCVLLFRSRTGFQSTDSQIQVLMIYVVNTGALASVVVIICLIFYAVKPNTEMFIAPYAAGSKLYLNALLASLNSRGSIRAKQEKSMVLSSISIRPGSSSTAGTTTASGGGPIGMISPGGDLKGELESVGGRIKG